MIFTHRVIFILFYPTKGNTFSILNFVGSPKQCSYRNRTVMCYFHNIFYISKIVCFNIEECTFEFLNYNARVEVKLFCLQFTIGSHFKYNYWMRVFEMYALFLLCSIFNDRKMISSQSPWFIYFYWIDVFLKYT